MASRFVIDQAAVDALGKDPAILAAVEKIAEDVAARIRKRAPEGTGTGAQSVHVEPDPDGAGFRVGWDKQHFYLSFHEYGTQYEAARPFVRPTVDEFNRH